MAPHRALGRVILGPGWGRQCGLAVMATLSHMMGSRLTHSRVWFKVECMETLHGILPAMAFPHVHGTATAAALVDLEHHEVVAGEVVEKASPAIHHSIVQGNIAGALYGLNGHGWGEDSPGGWWLGPEATIELEPGEVYQPDLAGWHIERLPELTVAWPVRVVPDWVCAILSPSTAKRDIGHKQRAYHRARVSHYWVADPVHLTITVYRWREDGYGWALAAGAGDVVRAEPFVGVELNIDRIFGLPPKQR